MRARLFPIAVLALLPGCGYLAARGRDLGDIVRLEGSVGIGLQADISAVEILHIGLGSSRRRTAGWAYGIPTAEKRREDHLPLSYIRSLIDPDVAGLHSLKMGSGPEKASHRCDIVGPFSLSSGSVRKPAMQFWSIEAGVFLVAVGIQVGANPAELLDFVLGVFGFDIAGDDDEAGRDARKLWIPAEPELKRSP